MDGVKNSIGSLTLLSQILLSDRRDQRQIVADYTHLDFGELWELATSHHVIMRAFPTLCSAVAGKESERAAPITTAIAKERSRIENALAFLSMICRSLEKLGEVIVIKSLDHWPDLGSDLDLYTNAESTEVVSVMSKDFGARLTQRSWGDRLAGKWNFIVPGLPELVEVHAGRLGQTGEQVAITDFLVERARLAQFGSRNFRVPAVEDRLLITTLQRMYRHFYLRLCDIIDTTQLVKSSAIDYTYLRSTAQSAGLWDGLVNYLVIVSEYVRSYRGEGLALPISIINAARFGNERLTFRRRFLRVPLFPQAASFYAAEWKKLLFRGEFGNMLRLSLLPGLAVAAALELKMTGSDKGIW